MKFSLRSLFQNQHIYNKNDMLNKLFCTFTEPENLEEKVASISRLYEIKYNKIFAFSLKDTNELILTYNVELGNISGIPQNTVLVHRKKETQTLYSINALNFLIEKLNNGKLDTSFVVNWNDYKNCLLLTSGNDLRILNTKIYKIFEV